ncbi:MAG TPA: hypothetical protein VFD91_08120 [Mariniphaga sp.]|nr:hypothetical protein [Mariniphaga sp.]
MRKSSASLASAGLLRSHEISNGFIPVSVCTDLSGSAYFYRFGRIIVLFQDVAG